MSSVKINPKTSKWLDVAVSLAAAVVIFGALQKILHTAIADLFLQIGLYAEAGIFAIYGIIYILLYYNINVRRRGLRRL